MKGKARNREKEYRKEARQSDTLSRERRASFRLSGANWPPPPTPNLRLLGFQAKRESKVVQNQIRSARHTLTQKNPSKLDCSSFSGGGGGGADDTSLNVGIRSEATPSAEPPRRQR